MFTNKTIFYPACRFHTNNKFRRPMEKCSTLFYLVDNQLENPIQLIDADQLAFDMDNLLNEFFQQSEFEVPSRLVEKTLLCAKTL